MTIYVVIFAVFVAVSGLIFVALDTVFSEERAVSRRLRDMGDWQSRQAQEAEPLLKPFSRRVSRPVGDVLRSGAHLVAPRGYVERVRHRVVLAGNPAGVDAERLIAIKLLVTAGTVGVFTALATFRGLSGATWLFVVVPLVLLAFFGPDLWLSNRVSHRQLAIRRALPDMLDMLTISVEAGLGFDAALAKLVRNSEGPLAQEFARLLQEVQAGVDRSDALRHMAARTEVSELNAFIMAIIQAEVFGISISGVLRTQAGEMRTKRRQYAEEAAQKAPVKLVFPLILCILPTTLIVILGPAIISAIEAFS